MKTKQNIHDKGSRHRADNTRPIRISDCPQNDCTVYNKIEVPESN